MPKYNTSTTEVDFNFQYPDVNASSFTELKSISGIKINPNKSELENIKDIIGYAHNLFTHNGDNTPSSADPLTILKETKAGQSFRCVEYSTLATGLLWAYGIPARTVGLKMRDVETRESGAGHVVIEFWSKENNKWIMCDVQAGIIPKNDSELLSAYELSQSLDNNDPVIYFIVTGSRFLDKSPYDDKQNYSDWIKEYLYFIDTLVNLTLGNEDRKEQQIAMLVPLSVEPPIMFQGMFKMNVVYTHSVLDFYPKI